MRRAAFRCREALARTPEPAVRSTGGILVEKDGFRVRAAILDHQIPCLAFALEENQHVNVWKNRLEDMGLGAGPWLRDVKDAVLEGRPDATEAHATWRDGDDRRERTTTLGEVRRQALRIVPGRKIAYVVDVVFHDENMRRVVDLAQGQTI